MRKTVAGAGAGAPHVPEEQDTPHVPEEQEGVAAQALAIHRPDHVRLFVRGLVRSGDPGVATRVERVSGRPGWLAADCHPTDEGEHP